MDRDTLKLPRGRLQRRWSQAFLEYGLRTNRQQETFLLHSRKIAHSEGGQPLEQGLREAVDSMLGVLRP